MEEERDAGSGRSAWGAWLSRAAAAATLAVAYYASGKLGLKLAFVHPSATAVWPPAGIALAALLVWGPRIWPGILVGAFLVNITTAGSFYTSLGIALGNLLEALYGSFLVARHARGVQAFERPQDVFRFAVLGGLVATLVSPTLSVTSLCLGGYAPWSEWGSIALTWWLGDAGGSMIVAPLLILWARGRAAIPGGRRALEAGALLIAVVVVAEAVFGSLLPLADRRYPLEFLCFPVLVWAAFRFGPRETATAAVVLAGIAIWGTLRGYGPFAREAVNASLLLLQAFLAVITVMALALAAGVHQQGRAHDALRAGEAQLRLLERRQAEEAERLRVEQGRTQFIANAAHELRTPLTAIVGLAEIVGSFRANLSMEQIEDYCQMIRQQGDRTRRLITGLLDLSRMEQGLLSLDLEPVPLISVARRAADAVPLAGREIRVEVADSLSVRADALRLEEVLVNLLRNASLHGGPQVALQAFAEGGHAVLSVSDDGEGVPEELVPQLFAPFTRGKAAAQTEGTGLGLAIARGMVEAMGGTLDYEPGRPRGARFVIRLERVQEDAAG